MRVAKNACNSHHLSRFFVLRETQLASFSSLQRAKIKIRCCTVLQVQQLLAGVSVVRFYYFLTNLRASNAYITAFIEGGKSALVKEPFLCTFTANCRRVELLLSVSCD